MVITFSSQGWGMGGDREALLRPLGALVRINSINPLLVPGAPGEREIAGYVARRLAEAGAHAAARPSGARGRPAAATPPAPGRPRPAGRGRWGLCRRRLRGGRGQRGRAGAGAGPPRASRPRAPPR